MTTTNACHRCHWRRPIVVMHNYPNVFRYLEASGAALAILDGARGGLAANYVSCRRCNERGTKHDGKTRMRNRPKAAKTRCSSITSHACAVHCFAAPRSAACQPRRDFYFRELVQRPPGGCRQELARRGKGRGRSATPGPSRTHPSTKGVFFGPCQGAAISPRLLLPPSRHSFTPFSLPPPSNCQLFARVVLLTVHPSSAQAKP